MNSMSGIVVHYNALFKTNLYEDLSNTIKCKNCLKLLSSLFEEKYIFWATALYEAL